MQAQELLTSIGEYDSFSYLKGDNQFTGQVNVYVNNRSQAEMFLKPILFQQVHIVAILNEPHLVATATPSIANEQFADCTESSAQLV